VRKQKIYNISFNINMLKDKKDQNIILKKYHINMSIIKSIRK